MGSRLIDFPAFRDRDSVHAMRIILLCLTLLLATTSIGAATPALATPSLAAQEGSWVCLPDDQTAPQVFVDFEEKIYRRCDQNICSMYDILGVRPTSDATEVSFAPGAKMRADDDGARYTETIAFGNATITSSGACTFRGNEPEPETFEKEEMGKRR
ncbi:MAG: hypothetical protein GKS02_06890 [Alphaproteobacteria bacterium]|nr:hypothetical protein [Alphaproteobacteria bacterium]